jgi:hypothetical protein
VAAGAYLALDDKAEPAPSFNTQTALYFATLAAFSVPQPERMLTCINRLLPLNYRRPMLVRWPEAVRPVNAELLRLRPGALATLEQFPKGQSALKLTQAARRDAETLMYRLHEK